MPGLDSIDTEISGTAVSPGVLEAKKFLTIMNMTLSLQLYTSSAALMDL